MRIATLTTWYANNYGALLQTHALLHVLEQMGYEAETIAYLPDNSNNSWQVFFPMKSLRNAARNVYMLSSPDIMRARRGRIQSNRRFISEQIQKTPITYCGRELSDIPDSYDCIICGSDQIWNNTLFPSLDYFMDFTQGMDKVRRIAYAASICEPFDEKLAPGIARCLEHFSAISIREEADLPKISALTDHSVSVMPDPVFVAELEYWKQRAIAPKVTEPYILCYYIGGERSSAPIVNTLAEKTGYQVINLATGFKKYIKDAAYPAGVGPFEFIGYIQHAALVLTNSFHCTAFSILFGKPFYLSNVNEHRRGRLDQITSRFCCDSHVIDLAQAKAWSMKRLPDAARVYGEALESVRQQAREFLRQAIEGC